MVWECSGCATPLPEDSAELPTARFCRECGAPYFSEEVTIKEAKKGSSASGN